MFDKLKDAVVSAANRAVYGEAPKGGPTALEAISLQRLNGQAFPTAELGGKVVLFVNVASRCGLTPQYGALADLQKRFSSRGFVVVGAPCNQFLGQEPGSAEEIASFCSATYGVDFPLLEKQDVNGAGRSALYQWLIGSEAGGGTDIKWNFEKFLVNRQGQVVARFAPTVKPDDPSVIAAIESALNAAP
jgi:glutathione peroxidase